MRSGVVVRKPGSMAVLAATGAVLALAAPVDAQRRGGPGGSLDVSFVAANAVGDLGTSVDQGFGMQLGGALPAGLGGHVRVRADLGFVVYGLERIEYCYSPSCRVGTDLTTTNSILYASFGPEIVLADGPVQPYVNASVGISGFVTSSSLNDHDGYGPYGETTNYSDAVLGWKAGGGLRLRVGNGHRPVFLDMAVERHDNGVADYLTAGDIVDNPDGSVTVYPNRSDADLLTFRLGVSIGFPSRPYRR